jgi:superfamily II DNA or RNA helicase
MDGHPIDITLDAMMRVTVTHLDPKVIQDIQDVMTIPNRDKLLAQQQHLWGADRLEDNIALYAWAGQRIVLPRGFFYRLKEGLESFGYETNIINNMTCDPVVEYNRIDGEILRPYQRTALHELKYWAQGIYQAPTGSGKTVTMLATIADLRQRSLVIVNKKELVQQWVDRAEQYLGYTPGFIGDGRWEQKDFTIAMQQTLWAKRDEIDPDWWAHWGFVLLDECHSVQADTYHEVMERFPAMYRFGVSATPKKTGDFKICESVLGPIVHHTPKKPLQEQGYLIKPKAFVVPTDFYYPFHRDEIAEAKNGRKYVKKRNNWPDLVAALISDVPRNNLIAELALALDNRTTLILSKRLEHLEQLRLRLSDKREVLLLTGAESLDERMRVYERASCGNCIILSTLADEAVDIPRIDTVFLVFPIKNIDGIKQQFGRGERTHPEKEDFIIYDFVDFSIPPIKAQYRDRRNFLYRPSDIDVTKLIR